MHLHCIGPLNATLPDMRTSSVNLISIQFLQLHAGIVCCYIDNHWKEQRRFTLRAFRNYGMGRAQGMITDAIVCEVDHGINELSKLEEPFDPTSLLYMITCNTTCQLVFGRRYDYDDAQYLEFIRDLNRGV